MTNDEQVESLVKDLSLKDTQQQQQKTPFQVVLVDIEKTAETKAIHCVKKPLDENDLKFVALSYRWGELHEILVDTKVGYTASITSFDLDDFYQLCYMMTLESDLKDIKYVWVDAICVDQRPSKRKATIYQMNNIYHKATYILAVPDLHLAALRRISFKNHETIAMSKKYRQYIYHLIHEDTDLMANVEQDFLNDAQVPKEPPELRQMLLKITDYFTASFITQQTHHALYCPVQALDHICESTTQAHRHGWKTWIFDGRDLFDGLHQCHEPICPIELYYNNRHSGTEKDEWQVSASQWKSKIIQRGTAIQQSMVCLTDLIKDWSSRVWVASEYSIAKQKNNLKYWFIQLAPAYEDSIVFRCLDNEFIFFKFNFKHCDSDNHFIEVYQDSQRQPNIDGLVSVNPVYEQFKYTMIRHLKRQTFLEMILISKASRNEDRFYSILPLSKYAGQITEVAHWNIHSMLSVKLKLYEIMDTTDKLVLFFWSSNKDAIINGVLPTFATSTLPLNFNVSQLYNHLNLECNFNLNDPYTIRLLSHHQQTNNNKKENDDDNGDDANQYFIRLRPREYFVLTDNTFFESHMDLFMEHIQLLERLGVHHASSSTLDIVSIPIFELQFTESLRPLSTTRIWDSFFLFWSDLWLKTNGLYYLNIVRRIHIMERVIRCVAMTNHLIFLISTKPNCVYVQSFPLIYFNK
ncbi:unnamed protein product [Absidia cylindrospora]